MDLDYTQRMGLLWPAPGSGVSLINPGAGPAPVSSPEAFGGNRRLYTLAAPTADHLVLTSYLPLPDSGSPPTHDYRCNLQCILRVVFKKHRFLQGFVAFAVSRFHLGDVKKCGFFHSFCFEGRKKSSKVVSEDVFNINGPTSDQHRPKIAHLSSSYAQHSLQAGPT